ncbi:hypothetical protein BpHYR1_039749 [Brachionus plicatilis]|uniref:Uncharacterized protein n=1 Tax=Brachionus plicatilis TaxID=10195 RepID=A0A3M7QHQ4_BRAPC|nr:hypothetical protein BpHYR1_039749 [Brachionus plicatilis]
MIILKKATFGRNASITLEFFSLRNLARIPNFRGNEKYLNWTMVLSFKIFDIFDSPEGSESASLALVSCSKASLAEARFDIWFKKPPPGVYTLEFFSPRNLARIPNKSNQ